MMNNVQLKSLALATLILSAGPIMAEEVREMTVDEAKKAVAYFEPALVRNDWLAVFSIAGGISLLGYFGSSLLVEGGCRLFGVSDENKKFAKEAVSVSSAVFGFVMGGSKIAENTHERYDKRARPLRQALNGTNAALIKAIQDGEGYPFALERCNKLKD